MSFNFPPNLKVVNLDVFHHLYFVMINNSIFQCLANHPMREKYSKCIALTEDS